MESNTMPEPVTVALARWLSVHDEVAPSVIEGLYVVGSVALDDWTPHSDIDIVAVVADPSDPDLYDLLASAHEAVREGVTRAIDGPYVAWGDLTVPPMAVQRPWVLDGKFRVDGECFELNPVVWHTLANDGVVMRGDPVEQIGVYLDDRELRSFVRGNVQTYWSVLGEQIEAGMQVETAEMIDGAVLEWVALGAARMLYTIETGDVVSKSAAGLWAAERLPEFAEMLLAAVALRAEPGLATRSRVIESADFVRAVTSGV